MVRDRISKAAWLALLLPWAADALKLSGSSDSKIAKNVLESKGEGYCSVRGQCLGGERPELNRSLPLQPSGPIENTLCAYETIETLNKDLFPALHKLVEGDFFRHYKVSLRMARRSSVRVIANAQIFHPRWTCIESAPSGMRMDSA